MDELALTLIAAMLNGVALAIGMIIGTRLTGSTFRKEFERLTSKSPTAQRLLKLLEKSDEIFGDEQLVKQVTRFFKEAGDLVSSDEAKNFFKNATEALKEFSSSESQVKLDLPKKPEVVK